MHYHVTKKQTALGWTELRGNRVLYQIKVKITTDL